MKRIFIAMLLVSSFYQLHSYGLEKKEVVSLKQKGENVQRLDVSKFFKTSPVTFGGEKIVTVPNALLHAAKKGLRYFESKYKKNRKLASPRSFEGIVSAQRAKKTLQFIINTIEHDKESGRHRILSTKFLNKHFRLVAWSGDSAAAEKNNVVIPEKYSKGKIPKNQIRLTSYATFVLDGSNKRTKQFSYPLYQINDEKFAKTGRFKYTKQSVLSGALEQLIRENKLKPLVWLSRNGLEDALMQGSAFVKMPNGTYRTFNVYKNNGYSYDKKIKDVRAQKRYWYFKPVTDKMNRNIFFDVAGAMFAGDIFNVGIGKIIAIRYINPNTKLKEIRLGVLADAGGALTSNLYQLDLFAGVFRSKKKLREWMSDFPNTVQAYVLVKS